MIASTYALAFPAIDPVALEIGPVQIRWYALAYLAGIFLGWWLVKRLHRLSPVPNLTREGLDDMLIWAIGGILLGGRLGYVLFYHPGYYLAHPEQALFVWEGGMSFHGGLLGILLAFYTFCRRHKIPFLPLMDLIACVTPIGLFFGRIANFINGELYGRVTDAPWGMVFPRGGPLPRHPSQIYEAALEGLLLFGVLYVLARFTSLRARPGFIGGLFLTGYALARMATEMFREPDAHLGFLLGPATMGQLLSLPMLLAGLWLMLRAKPSPSSP